MPRYGVNKLLCFKVYFDANIYLYDELEDLKDDRAYYVYITTRVAILVRPRNLTRRQQNENDIQSYYYHSRGTGGGVCGCGGKLQAVMYI